VSNGARGELRGCDVSSAERASMTDYHHFIHRGEGHRAGRTYSVWMQPDLFGQWVVVRVHGGTVTGGGDSGHLRGEPGGGGAAGGAGLPI